MIDKRPESRNKSIIRKKKVDEKVCCMLNRDGRSRVERRERVSGEEW
jgi:hypothetical protein